MPPSQHESGVHFPESQNSVSNPLPISLGSSRKWRPVSPFSTEWQVVTVYQNARSRERFRNADQQSGLTVRTGAMGQCERDSRVLVRPVQVP